MDFEKLLVEIFGGEFIDAFKRKRPAGWVDLLLAFESRKRAATPFKSKPLNVSLPFSFTDYHQKYRVSKSTRYAHVGRSGSVVRRMNEVTLYKACFSSPTRT